MVELIKDAVGDDAKYGIATVQPNHALKRCRTRNLRVEYFLSEIAISLVEPRACHCCDRSIECSDDFVLQILEKQTKPKDNSHDYEGGLFRSKK